MPWRSELCEGHGEDAGNDAIHQARESPPERGATPSGVEDRPGDWLRSFTESLHLSNLVVWPMRYFLSISLITALCLGMIALSGCSEGAPAAGQTPPAPPEVTVSKPILREVTDYLEFPGETAPIGEVEIRARVTGHIVKVNFQDGQEVKKGDLLFFKSDGSSSVGHVGIYIGSGEMVDASSANGEVVRRKQGMVMAK